MGTDLGLWAQGDFPSVRQICKTPEEAAEKRGPGFAGLLRTQLCEEGLFIPAQRRVRVSTEHALSLERCQARDC